MKSPNWLLLRIRLMSAVGRMFGRPPDKLAKLTPLQIFNPDFPGDLESASAELMAEMEREWEKDWSEL